MDITQRIVNLVQNTYMFLNKIYLITEYGGIDKKGRNKKFQSRGMN